MDGYLQRREEGWNNEIPTTIASKSISITMPDGASVSGVAGETTPLEIAKGISPQMAKSLAVARVGDELWDLSRPLEDDCELFLCRLDSDEGREVSSKPSHTQP